MTKVNERSWFQNGSLGERHSVLARRSKHSFVDNSLSLLLAVPITTNTSNIHTLSLLLAVPITTNTSNIHSAGVQLSLMTYKQCILYNKIIIKKWTNLILRCLSHFRNYRHLHVDYFPPQFILAVNTVTLSHNAKVAVNKLNSITPWHTFLERSY